MQRLLLFLLRLLGPRWQITPLVADYFAHAARLGQSDHTPTQLIPIAARLWARGWLNKKFFDSPRDWILPYWAVHQLDPNDRAFLPRGFSPVVLNQTHRDWTTIGNLDSAREAIVDPRGLVTPRPNDDEWSLDTWVRVDEKLYVPSQMNDQEIEQKLYENLPMVTTRYDAAGLRVLQEAFAVADEAGDEWVIAAVTVENPRGAARAATVYLSPRPFNPEGVAPIEKIEFREENAYSFWVNGALGGIIPKPDAVACSNEYAGDVAAQIPNLDGTNRAQSPGGVATALAAYEITLPAHSSRTITVALPLNARQVLTDESVVWTSPDQLTDLRRATIARWREVMAQGMKIRVPDDKVQDAFEANKAYLLLRHDGDSITPGPFTYHDFWFRDAAYMLNALDQLGYHDQVNRVLKIYPRRLQKNGYFLAQDGEWDANGQALWTLVQHARLSGDLETLADQYWQMLNAAHWIDAARQKTKSAEPRAAHHGLLPAGMSAEHFGPNDYFFWDDFWGLAGLRAAEFAAHIFANAPDEEKLRAAFEAFRADVAAALARAAEKNRAAWMPASPYRTADSALVANLVALYPLQLFAPDDPRILATLEEIKRVAWSEDAFFHHVGHGGFGTYLSLEIAGCYLMQRRADAWQIIRWVLDHASPTMTWAEAIHPRTAHGAHGDGHHGWAAAEWISVVRNALLYEEGAHLVLTPALPEDWTYETLAIQVEDAATYFGKVDYTIAFGNRTATLVLKTEWREPPEYIEWNLPYTLKNAGGDRAGVEIVNNRVRINGDVRKVVAMW